MNQVIVQSSGGITLVGGAPISAPLFRISQQRAPTIVAVDGGADRCLALGCVPQMTIGDMDSISAKTRAQIAADKIHQIDEQETTDFDKALRSVAAPFVLAIGFLGARVDHELAVFNTLVQYDLPCVLLGAKDVVFHVPRAVTLDLQKGDRFSLFPMRPVAGRSSGLDWPIDGLTFAPDKRVGTSNRVTKGPVQLDLDGPGMLCILARQRLDQVLEALANSLAEIRSR